VYVAEHGRVLPLYRNHAFFDSLGTFYSIISATQGGWTPLSSEGRYMGASAWGENDRQRNPYYAGLRQLLGLLPEGEVRLNRQLANWHRGGYAQPYSRTLQALLGKPIPPADFWNPDHVLRVEEVSGKHPPATQAHLDKAAATQLVLEDALTHLIGHFIRRTGCHKLVLTGGVALNCVANLHLLETFTERFFAEALGQKDTCLQLWVPPVPSDQGTVAGAAFHWALRHGAEPPREPLRHAFYCGLAQEEGEITAVLAASGLVYEPWGNIREETSRQQIAQAMAERIAQNQIVALFQGVAETGPRALGHRSFLANPCLPQMRQLLNERIKYRELIRPLAPMLTLAEAQRWFDLPRGTAVDNYNAYNYMVLTARAKPSAHHIIPAVIHQDGTSRLQIVRPDIDPLSYAILQALGQRLGVEVAVNTSLNVGSPIVQTAAQAVAIFNRAQGLNGMLLVAANGTAWFCSPHT
jgi:carbamoyltransferase